MFLKINIDSPNSFNQMVSVIEMRCVIFELRIGCLCRLLFRRQTSCSMGKWKPNTLAARCETHTVHTQIKGWFPQGTRVFRQCKVPRAEVMFVTIQREERNEQGCYNVRNCPMFAVRLSITKSLYCWPIGSLSSTCILCTPPALQ
jgi:hypothetical protein